MAISRQIFPDHLLDIPQIEAGACECYQAVKGHYERLLAI